MPRYRFFPQALEISGARQVKMELTIPISKGEAYSELTITWACSPRDLLSHYDPLASSERCD